MDLSNPPPGQPLMSPIKENWTPKQRIFVSEYVKDLDGTRAATVAGCAAKQASSMSAQWLDEERFPHITRAIRDKLNRFEQQNDLKAEYVRDYIFTSLEFKPGDYFKPSNNGGWLISEDLYKKLPDKIRRMVEEIKVLVKEGSDGEPGQATYWVRFVNKTQSLALAAKYTLTQKIDANMNLIDWGVLAREKRLADACKPDPVEQRILEVESQVDHQPQNGSVNGNGKY